MKSAMYSALSTSRCEDRPKAYSPGNMRTRIACPASYAISCAARNACRIRGRQCAPVPSPCSTAIPTSFSRAPRAHPARTSRYTLRMAIGIAMQLASSASSRQTWSASAASASPHGYSGMVLSRILSLLHGAALMAAPCVALAQQANLQLTRSTSGIAISQTRAPVLTLSAANLGPNAATNVVVRSVSSIPGLEITFTPLNCTLANSGTPSSPIFSWVIGGMSAGETRACQIELRATPAATPRALFITFRVDADQVDPDTSNNTAGQLYSLSAFDVVSDLSVSAVLSPGGLVPTDQSGRLRITIRNSGPQAATVAVVNSSLFPSPFQNSQPFEVFVVPEDPCETFIQVEASGTEFQTGSPDGLGPTASITCILGIVRRAGATDGVFPIRLTVRTGDFGAYDPNPANDSIVLGIPISVVAVPAMSGIGLAVLGAALVSLAAARRRRPAIARCAVLTDSFR